MLGNHRFGFMNDYLINNVARSFFFPFLLIFFAFLCLIQQYKNKTKKLSFIRFEFTNVSNKTNTKLLLDQRVIGKFCFGFDLGCRVMIHNGKLKL